ncbi:hypothetical protein FHR90_000741 [Endobacter medicaginis]|uniref:DUF3253 domain-containing protein n=1 Tax=Endobacter medicaginis TaxID=1181271 RepID=A0A850NS85_9PROT|nr:DUF3253 domain-containing protein [Endobacter medicaginis]MBB3172927.1 hypothetical protein [Endobacter medicaginis]MCX5474852.1 DUF3253 domain-containing protein [Endobacter medicaginis]NVN31090.1 DUF3253 domain-containing protein [Endobacter medicaginis]
MSDRTDKPVSNTLIRETILAQTGERGTAKSICPSEVARALATEWQGLMSRVRREAVVLMQEGAIDILRKGKPVPAEEVRGVIRLRRRAAPQD